MPDTTNHNITMSTITPDQQQRITSLLDGMILRPGPSSPAACPIVAINLALTGDLTDEIPPCMSQVIGRWITYTQYQMPLQMRNSNNWKALLPRAAGTGRDSDQEESRLNLILDWMWSVALPLAQSAAEHWGLGPEWQQMTTRRTRTAAAHAASTACLLKLEAIEGLVQAACGASIASSPEYFIHPGHAAHVANVGGHVAAVLGSIGRPTPGATTDDAWQQLDPPQLLRQLVEI